VSNSPRLWSEEELPVFPPGMAGKNFKSLQFPLWTQNKAKLIETYLRLFVFITHHGTYIDGFAAPQDASHPDMWAAKLVLETEPKWFREFWLCDIDASGPEKLRQLRDEHIGPKRQITVLEGDFNDRVATILQSGRITEKTATFALLDQRTFECEWRTAVALSQHKSSGNKIEIFYFFPTGWIDRSIGAVRRPETQRKVERWWGRSDWADLLGMDRTLRARLVASRFEKELGYGKAEVYPIHSATHGGRVMYHMIHASDHPEALTLMVRAYRKVSGRPDLEDKEVQLDLMDFLREIQEDPIVTDNWAKAVRVIPEPD
jgi:three-Cys-motif partner protein